MENGISTPKIRMESASRRATQRHRYKHVVNLIRLMIFMSQRAMTKRELADRLGLCEKTVERMIGALEQDLQVPVVVEKDAVENEYSNRRVSLYRLERGWIQRIGYR